MPLHAPHGPAVRWFSATTFGEAVGDQMSRSLAPIIAVSTLGAGAATVGLLHSLGLAMFLLLSIPIGIIGDRLSRPTAMMTVSTAVRMCALLGGVLIWALGGLDGSQGIAALLAIMLVIGIADVVYTTGRSVLIPRLVPAQQIRPMMGRVHTAAQIGTALAPLVLTGLLAMTVPPLVWIGASLAYGVSILIQHRLHRQVSADGTALRSRPAVHTASRLDGVTHLLGEPTLRRVTASSALHNAGVMAANTLLPVIALTGVGLAPAHFAALAGLGSIMGIAGAASASRLTARFGLRRIRIAAALSTGAGVLVILPVTMDSSLVPGPASLWIGVLYALSGASTSVSAVAGSDLAARLSPRELIGAVAGAQRTATMGVMPLSALLIGLLGGIAGTTVASALWLLLTVAAAVPCIGLEDPDPPAPARAPAP